MKLNFRTYKSNRTAPPIIGLITICLLYMLIDPSANRQAVHGAARDSSSSGASRAAGQGPRAKHKTGSSSSQAGTQHADGTAPVLTPDDVLLIVKTGATVLWRRLPIHLSTTLSPERISPASTVIYSDAPAQIGSHAVLDVLALLPRAVRDQSPEFELYRAVRDWDETNFYMEHNGLPGDDEGPPGGWRLDKYKFLPLVQHAGTNWPGVKWYLYTEDDTYMFLPNVLHYLSSYDHRESHWLGGLGEKLGTTFAHGGSGFALSRAAWEQSFGKGGDIAAKYQSFVDEACCGDYALGKVLNDYGVRFGENHGDEAWSWGFNGLPHWKIEFSRENWCRPVLTWHHAHNRDIARYHELERSWDFSKGPLNYGDFYAAMIAPSLTKRKRWWDNMSDRYWVHSTTAQSAARPEGMATSSVWSNAWKSADNCEAACREWSECVQWYYYGDDCKMDDRVFMGHGYPEGMRYRKDKLESVSGWLTDRIDRWKCDS